MTKDQCDILIANLQAGGEYTVRGVEYPSYGTDFKHGVCVKITTQMPENGEIFVDWYDEEGRRTEGRSYFPREG